MLTQGDKSFLVYTGVDKIPNLLGYTNSLNQTGFQIFYNDTSQLYKTERYVIYVDGKTFLNDLNVFNNDKYFKNFIQNFNNKNFLQKLSGDYNIFIWDKKLNSLYIISSHLGLRPLNFINYKNAYYFSDRILNITPYLNIVKHNYSSFLEILLYNYTISNNTLIEGIKIFPPGNIGLIHQDKVIDLKPYWNIDELLSNDYSKSKSESQEIIDESLNKTIIKYLSDDPYIGISLTGGWDGRLLLSYILKNDYNKFFVYSFGTPNAPDIKVPKNIAEKMQLTYYPIYLNDDYYKNYFLQSSINNVILSDGMRSFVRTHYYYAFTNIGKMTNLILSGNCASNVVKFANRKPSDVYNQNVLELLKSNNKEETILKQINQIEHLLNLKISSEVKEGSITQITQGDINSGDLSQSGLFYKALLQNVERKYYGYEMKSYSDYSDNLSPFIDIDFIKSLSKTIFFGAHHDLTDKSLKSRRMTSLLYAKLINNNHAELGSFNTDRSFSTNDMLSFRGNIKVYKNKYLKRKNTPPKDHYGMHSAFSSVLDYVKNVESKDFPFKANLQQLENLPISDNRNKNIVGNYLSYLIWKSHVER